jgi:hypothetical protein
MQTDPEHSPFATGPTDPPNSAGLGKWCSKASIEDPANRLHNLTSQIVEETNSGRFSHH